MVANAQNPPVVSHLAQSKPKVHTRSYKTLCCLVPCYFSDLNLYHVHPLSSFYVNLLAVPRTSQHLVASGPLHLLRPLPKRIFLQITIWITLLLPLCPLDHFM